MADFVGISPEEADELRRFIADVKKRLFGTVPPTEPGITRGPPFRLFELNESLSAGGSSNAFLVIWDGDEVDGNWIVDENVEFEVSDFTGSMSGVSGNRGIAIGLFGKWVIFQLKC